MRKDLFRERVDGLAHSLAPAVLRVARFVDRNRARVLAASAADIAALAQTSDATVVRTAQALGFAGLSDLKRALVTALDGTSTPADDMRRTLDEVGADVGRAVDAVLKAHEEAMRVLGAPETRAGMTAAVALLHAPERIAIFGIGPSAQLARYACIPLGRAGRRTLLLDRTGRGLADQMLDLRRGDGLLAMAYGRPYREITAVLTEARRLGLPAVLLTDDARHRLAPMADVILTIPRGRAGRVALHGATLVALEAVVLGLTTAMGDVALAALDRLSSLRGAIDDRRAGRETGHRHDP